jgi:hypothetical protein
VRNDAVGYDQFADRDIPLVGGGLTLLGAADVDRSSEDMDAQAFAGTATEQRIGGSGCRLSRARSHQPVLPGGGAMPSATASNSTLTMAALALKAADAIADQLRHG